MANFASQVLCVLRDLHLLPRAVRGLPRIQLVSTARAWFGLAPTRLRAKKPGSAVRKPAAGGATSTRTGATSWVSRFRL